MSEAPVTHPDWSFLTAPGRPSSAPDPLRREALQRAVEAQRGPETTTILVTRAEAFLGFLHGQPTEHPGTVILSGADIGRMLNGIARGGLLLDDPDERRLLDRLAAARAQQEDTAWQEQHA